MKPRRASALSRLYGSAALSCATAAPHGTVASCRASRPSAYAVRGCTRTDAVMDEAGFSALIGSIIDYLAAAESSA